ncbi:hypothetical protein PMAYCL1PPCAC_13400, partial [Pristionchus mayeri]
MNRETCNFNAHHAFVTFSPLQGSLVGDKCRLPRLFQRHENRYSSVGNVSNAVSRVGHRGTVLFLSSESRRSPQNETSSRSDDASTPVQEAGPLRPRFSFSLSRPARRIVRPSVHRIRGERSGSTQGIPACLVMMDELYVTTPE